MRRTKVTVSASSGVNGSAIGSSATFRKINGVIDSIYIKRIAGAVATTDVVIQELNNDPPTPVLTVNNLAADGWYHPRKQLHEVADGAVIDGIRDYVSIKNDKVQVSIAQANTDTVIEVTIDWEDSSVIPSAS